MFFLSLIALILFGVSIALILRAVALPRIRTSQQIDSLKLYGFEPPAPVGAGTAQQQRPVFADLAAALGNVMARRLRGVRPDDLRRELLAAGMYRVSPNALLGYRVLGFLVIGFLGFGAGSGFSPVLALVCTAVAAYIGWVGPLVVVRRRARFRLDKIDLALPDLIDLLVVTVEAGSSLAASLQIASVKFNGPLADELRLALQEQRMGRTMSEALMSLMGRADTPAMRSFVRSIVQGEQLGVSIGRIMRNLADEMRKRRRRSAEERAQKAPVKMLFPLILLILPALGVVILGPALFRIMDTLGGG
jgi:tight adherence protein C